MRRRLLNKLSLLGLQVWDLGKGAGLVTRGSEFRVVNLGKRSWLLTAGGDKAVDKATARATRALKSREWKTVGLDGKAQLVIDEDRDDSQERAFQKSAHNYLANRHIAGLLKHYGVNCVFDVGANVGQYAKHLRKSGYKGRIVSFEPVPHIASELTREAASDPEWLAYPCALGRERGSVTMNVVKGTMSSMLGPTEFGGTRYKRFGSIDKQEVAVRRLDEMMDEAMDGIVDPRPYLKLDTQGFDLEAFAGTGSRVKEFVGMQSEVALLRIYEGMPGMNEALDVYQDAGFEITGMYPVSREAHTLRVLEFDCVMVRASMS